MLALMLALQVVTGDSTYSSPALRRFIAEAAAANRAPPELAGYRARVESDIALLSPDVRGLEHASQLEQVASRLAWRRNGQLEQHVIGYRSRAALTLSALTVMRRPWVLPTLYGDRLRLMLGRSTSARVKSGPGTIVGVHPLAADRDSAYCFSGGDTTVILNVSGRTIPVVLVHVVPRNDPRQKLFVFRGDLYLDAARKQIVRMHGELMVAQHRSLPAKLRESALRGYFYVDIQEGEHEQRYWLPAYERIELQARSSLSDDFRPSFRVVTTFSKIEVDTTAATVLAEAGDSSAEHLTFAPGDSVNAFSAWVSEIGVEVTAASAKDFDNVARPVGALARGGPYVEWSSSHLFDVFRYNKVEGLYTGLSGRALFPQTPHLSAVGHAGFSWGDGGPRGAAELRWQQDRWRFALRGENELVNTNDFVPPLEGPATISALLFSIDDYDYVNRAGLGVSATRVLTANGRTTLRVEAGRGFDDDEPRSVLRGLILADSTFRPNRAVAQGGYWREAAALEYNPSVSGEFLEPGIGFTLSYERGGGTLRWQRVDALVTARHTAGDFTYWGRVDGAALFGGSPPQKVIEFGENEGMPGFFYKDFGGDRAVLGRAGVAYTLPLFRVPLRVTRWVTLPSPAPSLAVGLQGGWADAVSSETRVALASFGYRQDENGQQVLITAPTNGLRSSVVIALDFFGGELGVGFARPLEAGGRWRFILGSAQW